MAYVLLNRVVIRQIFRLLGSQARAKEIRLGQGVRSSILQGNDRVNEDTEIRAAAVRNMYIISRFR